MIYTLRLTWDALFLCILLWNAKKTQRNIKKMDTFKCKCVSDNIQIFKIK